jgi:hypothetical protein
MYAQVSIVRREDNGMQWHMQEHVVMILRSPSLLILPIGFGMAARGTGELSNCLPCVEL